MKMNYKNEKLKQKKEKKKYRARYAEPLLVGLDIWPALQA
jgi:hypothetical protein